MAQQPTFAPRQTVYDRSGLKFEFAEALSGGRALVRQIFEVDGYESVEEYPSETPTILSISALSAKLPKAAIAKEISEAAEQLAAVRREIADAKRAFADQEREGRQLLDALKEHPKLARIEDFLAGRITHFAVQRTYSLAAEVKTFDELMQQLNDYGRCEGIKLLSLFGKSGGDLAWRVNAYYDGSGSWTNCQPCASYEEAVTVAAEWLEASYAEVRADARKLHRIGDAIKAADGLSIPVPDDIRKAWQAALVEGKAKAVAEAEGKLAEAIQALATAQEPTPAEIAAQKGKGG